MTTACCSDTGSQAETTEELTRVGFESIEVFAGDGTPVEDGSDVTRAPWLYFVARVPAEA
jgi:hypothetical protein